MGYTKSRLCSIEGCAKKHLGKGYCSLHYQRELIHGSANAAVGLYERHGRARTPEHDAWVRMKKRCYVPTNKAYKDYGGRGITICDAWFNSFSEFLKDMGERPSSLYSLDRIDNNGNYEPGNCRWATRLQQVNNRRNSRTYQGKSVREWSEQLGVNVGTFGSYITRYNFEKAVQHYSELESGDKE